MSILLDALKRSESQRDLGRVPTLQTSTEPGAFTTRPLHPWMPGLMILLAAAGIGWMGWQQFRLPEGWEEAHAPAGPNAASQAGLQAGAGPATPAADTPAVRGKSILPQIPEADRNAQADTAASDADQRRLSREVRDYAAAEPSAHVAPQPAGPGAQPRRDNAVRQSELARVEVAPAEKASLERASPSPAGLGATAAEPFEPEIINYWQVPEKMREGLPDLRISVLVYAELPENRFVLLNGERLREGQQLPNGLLLEEIRRDRAIFNYRDYRFFLKS